MEKAEIANRLDAAAARTQAGDLAGAEEILLDLAAAAPLAPKVHVRLSEHYIRLERWTEATVAAQQACAGDPGNLRLRHERARALFSVRRPEEALEVIGRLDDIQGSEPDAFALLTLEGRASEAVGDHERMIRAYRWAATLQPDDEVALLRVYNALERTGRTAESEAYGARIKALRAPRLPDRLADGMEALGRVNREEDVPEGALDWAWELADQTAWDRPAWRAAVDWGGRARQLLKDWWFYASERGDEIASLTDPPDLAEVRAAMAQGAGCVLAGAHVGPTAGFVNYLQSCGAPFRTIGPAGMEQFDPPFGETLLPVRFNHLAAVRQAVTHLKSGTMIGILADAALTREAFEIEFLGRTVSLSSFTPRLIRRCGAASFWCVALWRGDRITIRLKQLPDPVAGESGEDWARRWFRAYLANLEEVMRGDPRNLDLRKGIWANLDSARAAPMRRTAWIRRVTRSLDMAADGRPPSCGPDA